MAFYHNLITKKSWQVLQNLRRKYTFILIGGWAVFLYTQNLKSKDIDLICSYKDLSRFKTTFDLSKNIRLKKYEFKVDEVDVDVYVPHFSDLGLPVEEVKNYAVKRQGFRMPKPEILLILKQRAYKDRMNSIKGQKDRVDIISLLTLPEFDFSFYLNCLKKYVVISYKDDLQDLLKGTNRVDELNLNEHQFSRFKKQVMTKLK